MDVNCSVKDNSPPYFCSPSDRPDQNDLCDRENNAAVLNQNLNGVVEAESSRPKFFTSEGLCVFGSPPEWGANSEDVLEVSVEPIHPPVNQFRANRAKAVEMG